ncbi:uncharacterized protein LOC133929394 [Phragmites australis]|uniref:uncharacterized protein LOC133929394 n=1 Tax=Phragmites australis TaxID=29695 RepID=UPI002D770F2E|nr:uncharacterized protein LOC133929394 [Phragmites australis]
MSPQQQHPVPRATVAGAVASLTKWMKKRAAAATPNLLADERDDLVLLQLSLRRVPASPTTRPHLLPLPHPVVAHAGASVCVISDDRPNSRSPPASDLLDASKSLHFPVSEVIPLSTLRTDYRPYESRRRLAGSHDLFIADRAILPLLPRVLGKAFYSTKKAPIGVDFTRVGWPEQVRKVLGSSFLYLRSGTCSGIKVGRLDMEEEEILDNVMAAVEAAVEKVPKKWANVRALHLKAVDSVALPIYQAVPELGMKIEVPVARLEGEVGAGEVIDAAEVDTGRKMTNKKKALRGEGVVKEESGKRKRNRKEQDVVMQEEVQAETVKKGRKSIVVSVDEEQKVGNGKENGKRASVNVVEEASKNNKKGKKGKKDDPKLELEDDVDDLGKNKTKGKKGTIGEGKNKKSMKGRGDGGEVRVEESQEDKKSKGKKSDGSKIKKTRTRVRV